MSRDCLFGNECLDCLADSVGLVVSPDGGCERCDSGDEPGIGRRLLQQRKKDRRCIMAAIQTRGKDRWLCVGLVDDVQDDIVCIGDAVCFGFTDAECRLQQDAWTRRLLCEIDKCCGYWRSERSSESQCAFDDLRIAVMQGGENIVVRQRLESTKRAECMELRHAVVAADDFVQKWHCGLVLALKKEACGGVTMPAVGVTERCDEFFR